MIFHTLSRLPKQVGLKNNVEGIQPFVLKEEGILPVQLDTIQAI